ncbi:magnesium and cobalt transport protein CorA [Actinoplanes sp. NPDC051633]|uniref:magnesium and cobalt transport protein CorA n=1 Tax=Actinoplanes sp. NPDC051633 TaxID=3155670 RepID=UPI00343BD8F7
MLRWLRSKLVQTLVGPEPEQRREPRRHNPDSVIDCAVYSRGVRKPGSIHFTAAAQEMRRRGDAFVWLGLHEPDAPTMRQIAEAFRLHELTVEQALAGGHRPAVESIGDVTRIVLRTASYVEHEELTETSEVVDTGDVTVLLGDRFVITVRHGAPGALKSVRAGLEKRPALLGLGPWAVAYAVCTAMVDVYLEVARHVEDDLERLEESAFATDRSPSISQVYQLKREMVEFKRAVMPLQEPLHRVLDSDDLPAGLRPYFVDVRGRLARAVDRVAGFDELINSILQARLAQVSVDQNNDMRKIASWAAIAAVQTAIAGVYGMNFDNMPELRWKYGYLAVLGLMVVAAFAVHRLAKRAGWL